jgi:hypothetical protein
MWDNSKERTWLHKKVNEIQLDQEGLGPKQSGKKKVSKGICKERFSKMSNGRWDGALLKNPTAELECSSLPVHTKNFHHTSFLPQNISSSQSLPCPLVPTVFHRVPCITSSFAPVPE